MASWALISSTGPFSVGIAAASWAGATSGTKSSVWVSDVSSPANGVTELSAIGSTVSSVGGAISIGEDASIGVACSTFGIVGATTASSVIGSGISTGVVFSSMFWISVIFSTGVVSFDSGISVVNTAAPSSTSPLTIWGATPKATSSLSTSSDTIFVISSSFVVAPSNKPETSTVKACASADGAGLSIVAAVSFKTGIWGSEVSTGVVSIIGSVVGCSSFFAFFLPNNPTRITPYLYL